jgi:hypothetical protein
MPHVNDKQQVASCVKLLGGPKQLHHAGRVSGRRIIDTSCPGQQEFQALLLWCLLSGPRAIPWDTSTGRCFRDMHAYYSWVSPQPDHLASGWSAAARVARYLLPHLKVSDSGQQCSGIPGLRFAGAGKGRMRLTHLPTGGILELHDYCPWAAGFMTERFFFETGVVGRDEDQESLWQQTAVTSAELVGLAQWTLAPHAPLLSAVMARIHLLWRRLDNGAELDINPLTRSLRLSWRSEPDTRTLAWLLTQSAISIHGAREHVGRHKSRIVLGDSALELRGMTLSRYTSGQLRRTAARFVCRGITPAQAGTRSGRPLACRRGRQARRTQ